MNFEKLSVFEVVTLIKDGMFGFSDIDCFIKAKPKALSDLYAFLIEEVLGHNCSQGNIVNVFHYVEGLYLESKDIKVELSKEELEEMANKAFKCLPPEEQKKYQEEKSILERIENSVEIQVCCQERKEETQNISKDAEPQQEQSNTTKRKGRIKRGFKDLLVDDEDGKKLERIHKVLYGSKGKDIPLIILACMKKTWLSRLPTFTQVRDEFGDIGSKSNFNNYLNETKFKKIEIETVIELLDLD